MKYCEDEKAKKTIEEILENFSEFLEQLKGKRN